ncbi:MAG: c-type cytochrome domain-containing protein [Limisphaerales bacterium]
MRAHGPHSVGGFRKYPVLRAAPTLVACALLGTAGFAADAPAAPSQSPEAGFQWSAFIGPFHMVLLHFPIGFIAAATILEAIAWWRSSDDLRRAVQVMLWATVASGAVAAASGLLRAEGGGYNLELVLEHRNLAFGFIGVTVAAGIAGRYAARRPALARPWLVYRGLLVLAFLLVGAAGHHGGDLTHGSGFLTSGAPGFISRFFESPPPALVGNPITNPASGGGATGTGEADRSIAQLYSEKIQPFFESRCYPCHGAEKHKGDFRLDQREAALRGGDSGMAGITPGEPMKSNVLRLLLLPRDHDDAMPPEGKPEASPEEILAIAHWIQAGAPFGTTPSPESSPAP